MTRSSILDDLADLERLGLIQQRKQLSGCDKDYYATRKGVRYASWLPTVPPKPFIPENDKQSNLLDFPPPPPPFPEADSETIRVDSIEIKPLCN